MAKSERTGLTNNSHDAALDGGIEGGTRVVVVHRLRDEAGLWRKAVLRDAKRQSEEVGCYYSARAHRGAAATEVNHFEAIGNERNVGDRR